MLSFFVFQFVFISLPVVVILGVLISDILTIVIAIILIITITIGIPPTSPPHSPDYETLVPDTVLLQSESAGPEVERRARVSQADPILYPHVLHVV